MMAPEIPVPYGRVSVVLLTETEVDDLEALARILWDEGKPTRTLDELATRARQGIRDLAPTRPVTVERLTPTIPTE